MTPEPPFRDVLGRLVLGVNPFEDRSVDEANSWALFSPDVGRVHGMALCGQAIYISLMCSWVCAVRFLVAFLCKIPPTQYNGALGGLF